MGRIYIGDLDENARMLNERETIDFLITHGYDIDEYGRVFVLEDENHEPVAAWGMEGVVPYTHAAVWELSLVE